MVGLTIRFEVLRKDAYRCVDFHANLTPSGSFLRGNQHITVPLLRATSDTVPVVNAALAGLRRIYRPGYAFIKAGVMLLDLHSAKLRQGELDLEPKEAQDCTRERLMGVLDELNQRYGRGTLKLASAGVEALGERASWAMRQERRSPAYTTCWDDMLVVGE